MRNIPPDYQFSMRLRVTSEMTARFFGCTIHPVYATFAIIEHGEYAARQAILPFLETEEDAVGSMVELEHLASAPVGAVVQVKAQIVEVEDRSIRCRVEAWWGDHLLARGWQRQHVVSKERLRQRIEGLYLELENLDRSRGDGRGHS